MDETGQALDLDVPTIIGFGHTDDTGFDFESADIGDGNENDDTGLDLEAENRDIDADFGEVSEYEDRSVYFVT